MVFRNGGTLRRNEKWNLNYIQIENTTYYKYLGLTFSNRLIWSMAQRTLAAQANKVIALIQKTANTLKFCDVDMLWILFDKMVLPILTYGSEIWGCDTHACIERVQNNYCKYVLKLPTNTTNIAVRGECGRYSIKTVTMLHVLKYWCKLLYMNDERLPKSCYNMLYRLDNNGRVTWATKVKFMLHKLGFGICWISQDVGDVNIFLNNAKQRLLDIEQQDWHAEMSQSSKLRSLCEFKSLLIMEPYLKCVHIVKHRMALAKL